MGAATAAAARVAGWSGVESYLLSPFRDASAGPTRAPRIVVLGDVMLDRYLRGDVRLSQEGAVIGVDGLPPQVEDGLGGAGNAAASAAALGAEVSLLGIVGADDEADVARALAGRWGMDAGGLITDPSRPTTLKTRIFSRGQRLLRLDREQRQPPPPDIAAALIAAVCDRLPGADVLLISDYDKGVVRGLDVAALIARARAAGVRVLADPKPQNAPRFLGVDWLTPNEAEARAAAGLPSGSPVAQVAHALRARLGCGAVAVTRGAHGAFVDGPGASSAALPSAAAQVVDETGAGDTFIAALAVALAGGASADEALRFASAAAGVVVGRPGTATVTRAEVEASLIPIPQEPLPCGA